MFWKYNNVISPYFQNSSEIFHFLYISQFSKSIFWSSVASNSLGFNFIGLKYETKYETAFSECFRIKYYIMNMMMSDKNRHV